MSSTQRQQILNALDAHAVGSAKLSQLTAPLYKHFGITCYGVTIIYETGQWLHLNTNKAFQIKRIENDAASKGLTRLSSPYWVREWPQLGMYLEDHIASTHTTLSQLLVEHDLQNPFACLDLIKTKKGNALRLSAYRAPKAHQEIKHFYLNNIELLKRFNHHIEKELAEMIVKLPLITPTSKEQAHNHQHLQTVIPDTKRQEVFVEETRLHYPKFTELAHLKLSEREQEIIAWFLLGKTEADTAELLKLSEHTIHTHFRRLKRKWNCFSKTQLLLKLIDANLITPDTWRDIYPKR